MIDELVKSYLEAYIEPILKRISTLEMVVTILSNKMEDSDCRYALKKFCGDNQGEATKARAPSAPLIPNEEILKPVKKGKEQITDFLASLDPINFKEGRTTSNIAQNLGLTYSKVYSALLYNTEDFQLLDGKWYLRTTPPQKID